MILDDEQVGQARDNSVESRVIAHTEPPPANALKMPGDLLLQQKGNHYISTFEKTRVIGERANQLMRSEANPRLDVDYKGEIDPLAMAIIEYEQRKLNLGIRRFYQFGRIIYYHDFHLRDLKDVNEDVPREIVVDELPVGFKISLAEVTPKTLSELDSIGRVSPIYSGKSVNIFCDRSVTARKFKKYGTVVDLQLNYEKTLAGKDPVYDYLNEEEVDFVLLNIFDATKTDSGHIHSVRAPTVHVGKHFLSNLRDSIQQSVRMEKFPNDLLSLIRLAQRISLWYYQAEMPAGMAIGFQMAENLVSTQDVISSFHNPGKKTSAMSVINLIEKLLSGMNTNPSDTLVFLPGKMDPIKAIDLARQKSQALLADMIDTITPRSVDEHTVHAHHYFHLDVINNDALKRKFGNVFVRIQMVTSRLMWNNILLADIAEWLNSDKNRVAVPSDQAAGYVDIFFALNGTDTARLEQAILREDFATTIMDRHIRVHNMKKDSIENVTDYRPFTTSNTKFILKEVKTWENGDVERWIWQIDRPSLHFFRGDQPLDELLRKIDSDVRIDYHPPMEGAGHKQVGGRQMIMEIRRSRIQKFNETLQEDKQKLFDWILEAEHNLYITGNPDAEAIGLHNAEIRESYSMLQKSEHSKPPSPMDLINAFVGFHKQNRDLRMQIHYKKMGLVENLPVDAHIQRYRSISPTYVQDHIFDDRMDKEDIVKVTQEILALSETTYLLSEGTNYLAQLELDGIDIDRSHPNDPLEIQRYLGGEATRILVLRNFVKQFVVAGKEADLKHIEVVVDAMTQSGGLDKLFGLDLGEMEKSGITPALSDRATANLLDAAHRRRKDNLPVSALAAMSFGLKIWAGTSRVLVTDK